MTAGFLSPVLRQPGATWRLADVSGGQTIASPLIAAVDSATRRKGLLGMSGLGDAGLAIAPCNLVHTWFMRFAIDVVFVDKTGTVLKIAHGVTPWRIAGAWGAFATIELASGQARRAGVRVGDRLAIHPA